MISVFRQKSSFLFALLAITEVYSTYIIDFDNDGKMKELNVNSLSLIK